MGPKVEDISRDNSNLFDLDAAQTLTKQEVDDMRAAGKARPVLSCPSICPSACLSARGRKRSSSHVRW